MTSLETMCPSGTSNYRDAVYASLANESLDFAKYVVLKYPFLKSRMDMVAKIYFTNESQLRLRNQYNSLNGLPLKPKPEIKIPELIKLNLKALYYLLLSTLSLIKLLATFPVIKKPMIGVEFSEGIRTTTQRSDIPFDLNRLGEECFVFVDLNGAESNFTETEYSNLSNALDKGAIYISTKQILNHTRRYQSPPVVISPFVFHRHHSIGIWAILGYIPAILISELFWKTLFIKFKIKGWLHTSEFQLDSLIQRDMIRSIGGISFTRQRSEQGSVKGLFYQPGDVLFNWSAHTNQHFCHLNKNLIAKNVGHYYLSKDKINDYQRFSELQIKNLGHTNFTIALFDNLVGNVFELSQQNFFAAITFLVELLETNPSISLFIKLKKKKLIKQYPDFQRIQKLIDKNQVALFDGYLLPLALSYSANLSIGIGSSSPVWEINIAEKRGIYFWPAPSNEHPLSKPELSHLLARDIEQLKTMVFDVINNSNSKYGLVPKNLLHLFDQYHDFGGPERVLKCLKYLLNENVSRNDYLKWINEVNLSEIEPKSNEGSK